MEWIDSGSLVERVNFVSAQLGQGLFSEKLEEMDSAGDFHQR